jgi:hypothetical protein
MLMEGTNLVASNSVEGRAAVQSPAPSLKPAARTTRYRRSVALLCVAKFYPFFSSPATTTVTTTPVSPLPIFTISTHQLLAVAHDNLTRLGLTPSALFEQGVVEFEPSPGQRSWTKPEGLSKWEFVRAFDRIGVSSELGDLRSRLG